MGLEWGEWCIYLFTFFGDNMNMIWLLFMFLVRILVPVVLLLIAGKYLNAEPPTLSAVTQGVRGKE